MIFSFEEIPESRTQEQNPPSQTRVYLAVGEFSDTIVTNTAKTSAPVTVSTAFGTLYRQNLRVEPAGWSQYKVTATYGPKDKHPTEAGSYVWTFDTTGGTVNIKNAISHQATYPLGAPANPYKGAINVGPDGDVQGTDIVIPALRFNFTFRHPEGVVTLDYAKQLARNTGKTNSAPWLGFDEGELLFMGATGSDGSETEAEIGYQFVASENATGLTIGDITGIAKKGHDYLWIRFKSDVDTGKGIVKPEWVLVDRVLKEMDFATILGWGS